MTDYRRVCRSQQLKGGPYFLESLTAVSCDMINGDWIFSPKFVVSSRNNWFLLLQFSSSSYLMRLLRFNCSSSWLRVRHIRRPTSSMSSLSYTGRHMRLHGVLTIRNRSNLDLNQLKFYFIFGLFKCNFENVGHFKNRLEQDK